MARFINADAEMKGYSNAQREMLLNAVKCEIPYRYIREMITGNKEAEAGRKEALPETELDITDELATMALKTLQQYFSKINGDCEKCICTKEGGTCWVGGCSETSEDNRIGQEGENELRQKQHPSHENGRHKKDTQKNVQSPPRQKD